MNFIQIVCLLCALVWSAHAGRKISDDEREMFLQMTSACKASEKASDDDMNTMMEGKMPETKEAKCFTTCVMKQFSIVEEVDGKCSLNQKSIVNMAKMNGVPKDKIDLITEMTEACKKVTHDDKCEYSVVITKCMEEEAIKRKLNPDDFS